MDTKDKIQNFMNIKQIMMCHEKWWPC